MKYIFILIPFFLIGQINSDIDNENLIQFKVFERWSQFDNRESLSYKYGESPLSDASIIINDEEYFTNEYGNFQIEKNKLKIDDEILIFNPMGVMYKIKITPKILTQKVILFIDNSNIIADTFPSGKTFIGRILRTIAYPFREFGKLFK